MLRLVRALLALRLKCLIPRTMSVRDDRSVDAERHEEPGQQPAAECGERQEANMLAPIGRLRQ